MDFLKLLDSEEYISVEEFHAHGYLVYEEDPVWFWFENEWKSKNIYDCYDTLYEANVPIDDSKIYIRFPGTVPPKMKGDNQ